MTLRDRPWQHAEVPVCVCVCVDEQSSLQDASWCHLCAGAPPGWDELCWLMGGRVTVTTLA